MHHLRVRTFLPALLLVLVPLVSTAGVAIGVSINIAPPALPVYVQPPCPAAGYIWTPGYWAWGDGDYYWVPGTWVMAPAPGMLWTPGYWGWVDGAYLWHAGYWGPHVGFYGGINYGFGYTGVGFAGGYWRGGLFMYNGAVANVTNIRVTNIYRQTVVVNNVNRVSFNGGERGIMARPSPAELQAAHERHIAYTPLQREHQEAALRNPSFRNSNNGGHPFVAASARPGEFSGRGVVSARPAGSPPFERGHGFNHPAPQQQHFDRPGNPQHAPPAMQSAPPQQHFDRPPAQPPQHFEHAPPPQPQQHVEHAPPPAPTNRTTQPVQQRGHAQQQEGHPGGGRPRENENRRDRQR